MKKVGIFFRERGEEKSEAVCQAVVKYPLANDVETKYVEEANMLGMEVDFYVCSEKQKVGSKKLK